MSKKWTACDEHISIRKDGLGFSTTDKDCIECIKVFTKEAKECMILTWERDGKIGGDDTFSALLKELGVTFVDATIAEIDEIKGMLKMPKILVEEKEVKEVVKKPKKEPKVKKVPKVSKVKIEHDGKHHFRAGTARGIAYDMLTKGESDDSIIDVLVKKFPKLTKTFAKAKLQVVKKLATK